MVNISSEFEWQEEYNELLEQIASSDAPDAEWTRLRDIIKYKIDENVKLFLSEANKYRPPYQPPSGPITPGGLRLPPFPPRERSQSNSNEAPKSILTEQEANEFKDILYDMLDNFDGPPFTIQRLCELCLQPRKHYNYIGKYLRAVEKTLLVTSTWDAFPMLSQSETAAALRLAPTTTNMHSTPSTPMFSPIAFLHEDARRSSSRSPPPSPLVLPALGAGVGAENAEEKAMALGLVDELDDPSPGHLSDHPRPLSATTSTGTMPVFNSLQDRFVKGSESEMEQASKTSGEGGSKEGPNER